jgi:hypothetical protein
MATNHMNGVAANGNDEHKPRTPRPADCETPLREMEALSTAIYALGLAADAPETGYRTGEATATLAWMIRDRLRIIDQNLFPAGSALGGTRDGDANV